MVTPGGNSPRPCLQVSLRKGTGRTQSPHGTVPGCAVFCSGRGRREGSSHKAQPHPWCQSRKTTSARLPHRRLASRLWGLPHARQHQTPSRHGWHPSEVEREEFFPPLSQAQLHPWLLSSRSLLPQVTPGPLSQATRGAGGRVPAQRGLTLCPCSPPAPLQAAAPSGGSTLAGR